MQTAMLQKKEKGKISDVESSHQNESRVDLKEKRVIEAGVPLFLQRVTVSLLTSPPPVQRQPDEEDITQVNSGSSPIQRQVLETEEEERIQTKLTVGAPDDEYEREAYQIADQVMRMPNKSNVQSERDDEQDEHVNQTKPGNALHIQRKIIQPLDEESEDNPSVSGESTVPDGQDSSYEHDLQSDIHQEARRGGMPLDRQNRSRLESAFQTDLGHVQTHDNRQSDALANKLDAQAFATGNHIFFRKGAYNPGTHAGNRLIAHETIHTLQQLGSKKVSRSPANSGEILLGSDDLEQEADQLADDIIENPQHTDLLPVMPIEDNSDQMIISRYRLLRGSRYARRYSIPQVNAEELLQRDYPHLSETLNDIEKQQVQRVLDTYREIRGIQRAIAPIRESILSSDVRRWERLQRRINELHDSISDNRVLVVEANRMLDRNMLLRQENEPPETHRYRQQLYRHILEYPFLLYISQHYPPTRLFHIIWGPNRWTIHHQGGLVRFEDLMRNQRFHLDFTAVNLSAQLRILQEMEEISRDIGNFYNGRGRKIGEIEGTFWDSDVEVGWERGDLGGYYNDSRGRARMMSDFSQQRRGGAVVIKDPQNFLHIHGLGSHLTLRDLTSPNDDGFAYILRRGNQVQVHQIILSDGAWMDPCAQGWRHEEWTSGMNLAEEFAVGAIMGDWFEEPTAASAIGQIVIGVIPIVGQVADARDVAAGVAKIWRTGGRDGKLQTVLALVGFAPLIGDSIKAIARTSGRHAAAEAFQRSADDVADAYSTALRRNSDDVARRFPNLERPDLSQEITSNQNLLTRALREESDDAARELATSITRQLDEAGDNAGHVVHMNGGNWNDLARGLARAGTDSAETMRRMQAWRVRQFELLEQEISETMGQLRRGESGASLSAPEMRRTGTNAMASDVDISFLGRDSTVHRNLAIDIMNRRFGNRWSRLLDADIFSDPTRLHIFDQLPAQQARRIEGAMVRETELNALARMVREGTHRDTVERMAREMDVPMDEVTRRAELLGRLGPDSALRQELELHMDVLHRRFLATDDPIRRAAIAEEMTRTQSRLNAAIGGPYMSPGGAARHVTLRDDIGGVRSGPFRPLSPAMNYMSFLDDLTMIEHVLAGARRSGLRASTMKGLIKYTERFLLAATQNGVPLSRIRNARRLYQSTHDLLPALRHNAEGAAEQFRSNLRIALADMDRAIDQMLPAVRRNAQEYLNTQPARQATPPAQMTARSETALIGQRNRLAEITSILLRNYLRSRYSHEGEPPLQDTDSEERT